MRENIFFSIICGSAYSFIVFYDMNKDMERYFHNFDRPKYYMYIYVKYIFFFVMIYNIKELLFNYK